MKAFVKYIEQLDADKELLDIYRDLRYLLQGYGWTEKDLEKPPFYSREMMSLYEKFRYKKEKLINELKLFFNDVDVAHIGDYIEHKMYEINQEIPLDKKKD